MASGRNESKKRTSFMNATRDFSFFRRACTDSTTSSSDSSDQGSSSSDQSAGFLRSRFGRDLSFFAVTIVSGWAACPAVAWARAACPRGPMSRSSGFDCSIVVSSNLKLELLRATYSYSVEAAYEAAPAPLGASARTENTRPNPAVP